MKVIDLLNKIANGEEVPEKIKIIHEKSTFNGVYNEEIQDYKLGRYEDKIKDLYLFEYIFELGLPLNKIKNRKHFLNDEIEIIEDTPKKDKIKELSDYQVCQENYYKIIDKINEIIDRLNGEDNE